MYLYSDSSKLFICGDFNSRIGDMQDYDGQIDTIPKHQSLDSAKNKFVEYLIDFLKDTKCCVLNGRGDSSKDNITFLSPIGRSVVDYAVTPHSELNSFSNFTVKHLP